MNKNMHMYEQNLSIRFILNNLERAGSILNKAAFCFLKYFHRLNYYILIDICYTLISFKSNTSIKLQNKYF